MTALFGNYILEGALWLTYRIPHKPTLKQKAKRFFWWRRHHRKVNQQLDNT
jgi:hypothetical protein